MFTGTEAEARDRYTGLHAKPFSAHAGFAGIAIFF
jgi:hypothetical protein